MNLLIHKESDGTATEKAAVERAKVDADLDALLKKVGETMEQIRQAEELRWDNKGIDDSDCTVIAHLFAALGSLPKLTKFNLFKNPIGDAGIQSLSQERSSLPKLTVLYLFNNQISDAGIQSLSQELGSLPNLIVLALYNNHIGNAGIQSLCQAFGSLPNLMLLGLSGNRIGDASIQSLSHALDSLPNLKQL